MPDLDAATLERTLRREFPLSHALGVRVRACGPGAVVLSAPLEPNLNHRHTVFGGSLTCLAILAGYGLAWHILQHEGIGASVVIQQGTADFRRPVTRDFEARCGAPHELDLNRFVEMLRRHGRARITLDASIHEDSTLAMSFRGIYVAAVT
jgi:thioesterase domain-containing protein